MQIKTYREQTRGWGYNSTIFLILLNVLVIALIFLLTNSNPSQKWLENPLYQEPKVHTYEHQDTQYAEQEKRYPETREPSEPPKIFRTAKIVEKSKESKEKSLMTRPRQ
jgi:hypothetical protein